MSGGAIAFLICSPIIGVFITRLIVLLLVKPKSISVGRCITIVAKFWDGKDFAMLFQEKKAETPVFETEEREPLIGKLEDGESLVIVEVYRWLMLTAAMMVCLGHGSNDVANSISPLLMVMKADGKNV